ncbi:hypothetical protein F5I97DRAFT_1095264 [Phlebopus sp. FC_14]|nr:hypothetical protein F5I97DRAFT_1095264 [Phlebopus sp. FC_14]
MVSQLTPSAQDIWKWSLTKDAIAPCFVRDVLAMRDSGAKDADFFWLGHIPCRTVLLVAMVVGVQVYENRTLYTVDDGTAVIDCILRHAVLPKSTTTSSGKHATRSPPKRSRVEGNSAETFVLEPPPPMTEPGYPVRVLGKVIRYYESRQIFAESIDPCISSLDEITHWRCVIGLHKSKYSLETPFVIPPLQTSVSDSTGYTAVEEDASLFSCRNNFPGTRAEEAYTLPAPPPCRPPQEQTRKKDRSSPNAIQHPHIRARPLTKTRVPPSPTASSIASSTPSSPSKASSPARGGAGENLKHKLRHPSRLHTRDLTMNTFRLYVKHYMDNAPPPPELVCSTSYQEVTSYGHDNELKTPTKRRLLVDETDAPTPRPRPSCFKSPSVVTTSTQPTTLGFTLSHLRRVPELALLAERVVRAETRKREKLERERAKAGSEMRGGARDGSGKSQIPPSKHQNMPFMSRSDPVKDTAQAMVTHDPSHRKMKRLFQHAVVKLYEEGSIVLWDGKVRELPSACPETDHNGYDDGESNGLWKTGNSTVFSSGSSSVLFSTSASASLFSAYHASYQPNRGEEDDTAYLSDPPPNEESYVPLTPAVLAPYVKEAIGRMRTAESRRRSRGSKRGRGNNGSCTAQGSRSAGSALNISPTEITMYLRDSDARWARVGVWAVEEALHVLNDR